MKKTVKLCIALLSLSALTGIAYAAKPGFYVGAGLGASRLDTPNQFLFNISQTGGKTSRQLGGLGGRIFGGYNFNEYFGVETGYARYAQSTYKANLQGNSTNSSIKYSLGALDVVGKGYLPLSNSGFNLYGLAGLARVSSQTQYKNQGGVPLAQGIVTPRTGTHTYSKVRPVYGVGVSYDIPQTNFVTNLEFSRIQGSGNMKTSQSAIPSANMLTLNVSYNFS